MYISVTHIPVSTVATVFNLSPIFIFFIEAVAHRVRSVSFRNLST
jgi:drug/metabolite transporter (DMT)-like permease